MDTWEGTCQSCNTSYRVQASNEQEAIEKSKTEHERNNKRTQFHCDLGPMINVASNLTNPKHPCAPRDW